MENYKEDYEQLMRWVLNDLRDMTKDTKKSMRGSQTLGSYLGMTVAHIDIKNVVNNEEQFQAFKKDVFERIGIK